MTRRLLALALACAGCLPAQRPADLADWDSCVVTASALGPSPWGEPENLEAVSGSEQVLVSGAKWGAGGLIAIEHNWGSLVLALPAAARSGEVLRFDGSAGRAQYREGHSITSYRSDTVVGSVRVIELDEDEVELELDLIAKEPSVDLARRGQVVLSGLVDADRVVRRADCG